ncbi:unnamed protein product [Schistosoma curassoni]|uniref:POU domain protein n=1 Tax=Schistosoma curassoni TaxID=6186 RepID=A0A183JH74_9TREM|nr:unnamed protein product [Schistosoma curassoni]VDO71797.1 unnamed protein product [Schistosoma curassoni]
MINQPMDPKNTDQKTLCSMHKMNHHSSLLNINNRNYSTDCKDEQSSMFQLSTLKFNDTETIMIHPKSDDDNNVDDSKPETKYCSSYEHPLNSIKQPSRNIYQNNEISNFRSPIFEIGINSCGIPDPFISSNLKCSNNDNNPPGKSSDLNLFMSDHQNQCQCDMSSSVWDKWSFLSSINSYHANSDCTITTTETIQPVGKSDALAEFVDMFKEKRIQLGITQAEVGRALGALNLSGFGCLSQSTICRFESLSLSHKNMLALKPVLEIWLQQMEGGLWVNQEHHLQESHNCFNRTPTDSTDSFRNFSDSSTNSPVFPPFTPLKDSVENQRRKRTCIMGREKYILESFFNATNCRPTSDQMNQLALRLNMPKSVIRVWFCNQRQKHKRLSKL